jgi:hypothetical protein
MAQVAAIPDAGQAGRRSGWYDLDSDEFTSAVAALNLAYGLSRENRPNVVVGRGRNPERLRESTNIKKYNISNTKVQVNELIKEQVLKVFSDKNVNIPREKLEEIIRYHIITNIKGVTK